jgi:hypothetical protein
MLPLRTNKPVRGCEMIAILFENFLAQFWEVKSTLSFKVACLNSVRVELRRAPCMRALLQHAAMQCCDARSLPGTRHLVEVFNTRYALSS